MSAWLPIVSLILGQVLLFGFGELGLVRRERRERERQVAERRAAFQRETFLALQDAIQDLGRVTGEMHHHDVMKFRTEGIPVGTAVFGELSQRDFVARAQMNKLAQRVEDDELRRLIEAFNQETVKGTFVTSESELNEVLENSITAHDRTTDRLGKLLRSTY